MCSAFSPADDKLAQPRSVRDHSRVYMNGGGARLSAAQGKRGQRWLPSADEERIARGNSALLAGHADLVVARRRDVAHPGQRLVAALLDDLEVAHLVCWGRSWGSQTRSTAARSEGGRSTRPPPTPSERRHQRKRPPQRKPPAFQELKSPAHPHAPPPRRAGAARPTTNRTQQTKHRTCTPETVK